MNLHFLRKKKYISWLNFLYVSNMCNFLNSSLILRLEESDESGIFVVGHRIFSGKRYV